MSQDFTVELSNSYKIISYVFATTLTSTLVAESRLTIDESDAQPFSSYHITSSSTSWVRSKPRLIDGPMTCRDSVTRAADKALLASANSKHCRQILRSVESIRREQARQRRVNRFIVHPFSRFRSVVRW